MGLLHQLCVLKGWGSPGHSRWAWGPELLLSSPWTQDTSLPSAFGDRLVWASLSSSPRLSIRVAREHGNHPSPDPSSPVGIVFKLKFYFLEKVIYLHGSK